MPVSAPYAIPVVVNAARQVRPRSILDVGVGFGKYGMPFREYLDLWEADTVEQLGCQAWATRIEGIEVYPQYLGPLHRHIYDRIHLGDVLEVIDGLGRYDLVFMGDVLEHFEKADGQRLVAKLYDHADRCVLLTYPTLAESRVELFGNEAEAHRSVWTRQDFVSYERVSYTVVEDRADVCAIAKPGQELPFLVSCFAARRRKGWKGRLGTVLVRTLGKSKASSLVSRLTGERVALRAE